MSSNRVLTTLQRSCPEGSRPLALIPDLTRGWVQEWARNQLDNAAAKALARLNAERFPAAGAAARAEADWNCPKCRQVCVCWCLIFCVCSCVCVQCF